MYNSYFKKKINEEEFATGGHDALIKIWEI